MNSDERDIITSEPILTVFALTVKSVGPVGDSNNLDMNLFAAADPDVVVELRLGGDYAGINSCLVANLS